MNVGCALGAVAGMLLVTGCTGQPGGDTEPLPQPDGPTASAQAPTVPPEQLELSEFLAAAADYIPTAHPGLLVVSQDGFDQVVDDGNIDRAGLAPPLPENHVWKCLSGEEPGSVVCLGLGDSRRFEPAPGPRCPAAQLERHRIGHSVVTHRTYGPDGRMTQQITHERYDEHYAVPGTDLRTQGGTDVFVVDDLAPDGTTVVTRRVVGMDSYQHTVEGELIWANHGEMRVEDPEGEHKVTVVSGRWDQLQDPDGARARLCAAFE